VERAIRAYEQALTVYTREALPVQWATTQNNLGNAYSERIAGDRSENVERAIRAYEQALDWFAAGTFPYHLITTGRNLGNAAFGVQSWSKARQGYLHAIQGTEHLRGQALHEDRRREIQEASIQVYTRMVATSLALGQPAEALAYADRSKARNLVEQMQGQEQERPDSVPAAVWEAFTATRAALQNAERPGQGSDAEALLRAAPRIQAARQHHAEALRRVEEHQPGFSLTQQVSPLPPEALCTLFPGEDTALLYWYLGEDRLYTFVYTGTWPAPRVLEAGLEKLDALQQWMITWLQAYFQGIGGWKWQLLERLQELAGLLDLEEVLALLPGTVQHLTLVPHRWLHWLPLHALPMPGAATTLLDRFQTVQYAPSLQLLIFSRQQQRPNFNRLLAVQNPTMDLLYADPEVATVQDHFSASQVLLHAQASLAAFEHHPHRADAHCLHFACHGGFNRLNPLASALQLADGLLSVQDVFGLSLRQCRLVTLSACETGLTELNSLTDEYIGLPSGFLLAGSKAVVSSLWAVDDLSTALLMEAFYSQMQAGLGVAKALNQAQRWVRNATLEQVEAQLQPHLERMNRTRRNVVLKSLNDIKEQQVKYPFAHPFHWAAFTALGS
jgi:tetratricopeptide (TPR) repeat protein